jgi:hypothetical protein
MVELKSKITDKLLNGGWTKITDNVFKEWLNWKLKQ